jgi:hypothetical protein
MRQRSLRWIGLVFTDNPKRLLAAVIADDRHRGAKPHLCVVIRIRHDTSRGAPRAPVAQVARGLRHRGAIARPLCDTVRGLRRGDRRLDLREAFRGDVVGMLGDRPIRQVQGGVGVGFFYEGSASPSYGIERPAAEEQRRSPPYGIIEVPAYMTGILPA